MELLRELFTIFRIFFGIGIVTFGGGLTMLPILERDIVRKRKWCSEQQLIDWFSISQCTSGAIAVNISIYIGHSRKGFFGALCATLGIVSPSIIVITFLALFLSNFTEIEWVSRALRGINVAVAVLLVSAFWSFAKKSIIDWFSFFVVVASFLLLIFFNVSGVLIVISSAILGIVFTRIKTHKIKKTITHTDIDKKKSKKGVDE